jgi:hypothetical protein
MDGTNTVLKVLAFRFKPTLLQIKDKPVILAPSFAAFVSPCDSLAYGSFMCDPDRSRRSQFVELGRQPAAQCLCGIPDDLPRTSRESEKEVLPGTSGRTLVSDLLHA